MTEQDIFTDPSGRESRVDFMHKGERGSFLRREGYQAASLNTHLGEMVFVLPDEGVSPESLLQDPDFLVKLDVCGADSRRGEVQWSVPKFDADSDLDLMEALKSLGITDLLDRVKVDEEGVEAAAVTMIMGDTECAPSELNPEVCIMDLDRPFLFVIRTQGVPLFVGVVNKV